MMTRSFTLAATLACLQTATAMMNGMIPHDSPEIMYRNQKSDIITKEEAEATKSYQPGLYKHGAPRALGPGMYCASQNQKKDSSSFYKTWKQYNTNMEALTSSETIPKNAKNKPWGELIAATLLTGAAPVAAYYASEYGVKNFMDVGNEEVTKALGITGDEFTTAQLEQHDLHDVLFDGLHKLEDVDVNSLTQDNFAQLTSQIYWYFMIGGVFLAVLLLAAVLVIPGKTKWYAAIGVIVTALGGSAVTAAGFTANLYKEAGHVWLENPAIWTGMALVATSFFIAAYYVIRSWPSCFKKPKVANQPWVANH